MQLRTVEKLGGVQLVLGVISTGLCLLALAWLETSFNGVLASLRDASHQLSVEVAQTREIVVANQRVFDETGKALATYSTTVTQVKQNYGNLADEAQKWRQGADDFGKWGNKVSDWFRGFGDALQGIGIPNGIGDWGINPPRLSLTWAHPLERYGQTIKDRGVELENITKTGSGIIITMATQLEQNRREVTNACDATVKALNAYKDAVQQVKQQKLAETVENMSAISAQLERASRACDQSRFALRLVVIAAAAGALLLALNGWCMRSMARALRHQTVPVSAPYA